MGPPPVRQGISRPTGIFPRSRRFVRRVFRLFHHLGPLNDGKPGEREWGEAREWAKEPVPPPSEPVSRSFAPLSRRVAPRNVEECEM